METLLAATQVLVRDSKESGGPILQFSATTWREFTFAIRNNEFEVPGQHG